MGSLSFRPATEAEADLVADLVFGSPDQLGRRVMVAVHGVRDGERLRPLLRAVWRSAGSWRQTIVAVDDEHGVVGLVQTGSSSTRVTSAVFRAALHAHGWRIVRLPRRLRIFDSVSPAKPAGAFLVAELHVHPDHRGAGIGTKILEHAEALARAGGYAEIALDTYTANPARRLYERVGYEAVAETHDPRFERLSGVAGRVLYVKRLPRT